MYRFNGKLLRGYLYEMINAEGREGSNIMLHLITYVLHEYVYAILCLATIIHYIHVLELLLNLFLQLTLHITILHKMTSTFSRNQHMKLCLL